MISLPTDLAVVGEGRAEQAVPASDRRIPSMYVDPVAWLLLESVEQALGEIQQATDDVGVLVVSTYATLETMAQIAESAPSGRVSPLRFAGASPGGAASLACLVHGFRGPSLLLTSEPAIGWPVALSVARSWLRTDAASLVMLTAHSSDIEHGHRVRTLAVRVGS